MAGTTVNENNVVYKTLRHALNEAGHNFSLQQVLSEGAGKEKLQAVKDILKLDPKHRPDSHANNIYQKFLITLENAYETLDVTAQEGAEKLFKELRQRGIYVVLNTGYDRKTAQSLLKKLRWNEGKEIDALIVASDVKNSRPAPDMIRLAIERFDIKDPALTAKVGDSIIDIEEGKNAGCGLSIGITTGAHSREQLLSAKPDFVIDHLEDLNALLK